LILLITPVFLRLNSTCSIDADCLRIEGCVQGLCTNRTSRCDLYGCPKFDEVCFNQTNQCIRRDSRCDLFGCSSTEYGCSNGLCIAKNQRCDIFGCAPNFVCQGTNCVSADIASHQQRATIILISCVTGIVLFLGVIAYRNWKSKQGTIAQDSATIKLESIDRNM
jgi:hypothetical protein